jgi:hypothetical protein
MPELAGDKLKIRINNVVFKCAKCRVEEEVGVADLSNSETEGFGRQDGVKRKLMVQASNATFDTAENYFQGPINLRGDSHVHLQIYPDGLDSLPYEVPDFHIEKIGHDFDAQSANGLQPFDWNGHSSGVYLLPGDVA